MRGVLKFRTGLLSKYALCCFWCSVWLKPAFFLTFRVLEKNISCFTTQAVNLVSFFFFFFSFFFSSSSSSLRHHQLFACWCWALQSYFGIWGWAHRFANRSPKTQPAERWANFCETGRRAYGLFWAHRYHLELNSTARKGQQAWSVTITTDS